ncbi:MAG: T9SS type A sorting domain-containing protein [Taibaiella sp.]|jgi:hypothetical protein
MIRHFTLKKISSNNTVNLGFLTHLCLLVGFILTGLASQAQTLTIGTGTTTTTNAPLASCMGYSYTQQIYTAAEILAANGGVAPAGQIVNVRFHLSTSSSNGGVTNNSNLWTVYLGNTTTSVFAATTAATWIPTTSMTQVFSGVVTFPTAGNWMTIPLAVPFTWDGTSNIVVAVDENQPNWNCTMYWTSTSTTPDYRTLYYNNDNTNPDPTAPPNATGRQYPRPNAQLQWALPCNTATGLPTTGSVTASPGTLCLSGNVTLNFTPATALPSVTGITYKWQSSPTAAGTYTDIPGAITSSPTYTTTTPITANTYFKCVMLCNGTSTVLTSTASNQVVVNNPGTPTVNGATRCGPGSVTLTATPPAGSTVNWYQNAVGGAPLFNGNSFNTGYIPGTTTFYAAAASGTSPGSAWIGTGTTYTSSQPHPFYPTYMANKAQFLVKASELIALGLGAGTVNSIGFDVSTVTAATIPVNIGDTVFNLAISMKSTALNDLTTTFESGLSPCYSNAAYKLLANTVNTFNFGTPFTWDGTSNVIVEVCFAGPAWGGTKNVKYTTGLSFQASHYQHTDNNLNQCSAPTGFTNSTSTSRPNMKFDMTLGCTGPRQPVVATVTTPPAVTKTAPAIACNNAITTISVVSSPMSNYTTYSWTPVVTDLYTNAAATTSYVSGNAPTVYMKSSTVGQHTYYMYATGATPAACAFADTVKIWVQPDSVYIKAAPDTICVSGTSMLKLIPQTGYAPNSIQWQESPNGTAYTDIAGATGVIYTTPTLTANRFYRAVIKSAGATPCLMPTKKIVVANPLLISNADSFNCGPGTVTLQASVGLNSGVKWYESMTASQPVGAGSPWITPYLGVTDTFYVAASSGTPQPDPANVVVAGSTGTMVSASLPLYYNKGHRFQWMITADEMTAQGYTEGLVKSIGFDFAGVNMTYQNISLKMKLTTAPSFAVGAAPGSTFTTGMDQVYTAASFTPTPNSINSFTLQGPFYWDGTSNIIIEMCHSNPTAGTFANSANLKYRYNYTYPNNLAIYQYGNVDNICSAPTGGTINGPYPSYYRPHTIIGMVGACESARQAVIAYIHPVPVVDLGQDINICVDAGYAEVLDAGVQPNTPQFLWDNGDISQVRAVSESGTYNVKVTNQYGCSESDTIGVILRPNPVVELGNDTTVCNGVVLTLNPGNDGIEYFWNTGQTSQIININSPGSYNVFVTNSQGCIKGDTIVINMQGELPSIQGINVTNNGQYTFQFTAVNPQNVIGYDWDFGDGSAHSYQVSPTHTYANNGNYIVVLHLSSTCGFLNDSSSAHILGINQLNVTMDELTVYPNPTREVATILNRGALKMEQIEVYNVLGQVIYKSKADSKNKHTLKLEGFASGVYTIQVFTDKGTVARKLEIIK